MKREDGTRRGGWMAAVCALALALAAPGARAAATNGFAQTGAGPYDYNTATNWVGSIINGIWDASLSNTANQTITFGADTTLTTPLQFYYASGNNSLTFRSDGTADRALTLGGDITVAQTWAQTVAFGSAAVSNKLTINLGGVTRTCTVSSVSRNLTFNNMLTNGSLVQNGGTLNLNSSNVHANTTLNSGTLKLGNAMALGSGTLTIASGPTIDNSSGAAMSNANNNAMAWNGSFTFTGTKDLHLGAGSVALGTPLTLSANASTLTVGGTISGGNGIFDVTKAGSGAFVYTPDTALTTNQTVAVTAGTETLNGALSGNFSLTKAGAGTLLLNGANSYNGGTVVSGGTVQFSAGALPSSGLVTLNAGGALDAVGAYTNAAAWLASGRIDSNSAGTLMLTGSDSSSIDFSTGPYTALYLGASANATLSGTITAGPNGYFLGGGGSTLTLSAADALSGNNALAIGGNVTLTTSNSVSGLATVGSGTLTLANTNGALANEDLVVKSGTILALDSSVSGVSGATRAKSVTLQGAALTVKGNSGANSVDTITGALTVDAPSLSLNTGVNIVTLTNGAARNCQLAAGSLVRTNSGVVLVRGPNLGQNTIASTTANSANLSLGTTPALVGGSGAAGSTNISVIPWAIGDTNATGGGSSFVTYDAANGIRPLAAGEYDVAIVPGTTPITDNISLALGATTTTVTGAATVNSLLLSGTTGGNLAGAGALTVASGAIYGNISGNGFTISKPIDFGTVQGVIGTSPSSDGKGLFISGGVTGSGGLVLYNTPTLMSGDSGPTLKAAASYTGDTYVVGGATVTVDNVLPNGSRGGDVYVYGYLAFNLAAGGSLTINGLNGTGVMGGDHSGGGKHLNVGSNGDDGSFSGKITQGGVNQTFTKIGAGTQILSGTNSTYTGATAIQNGVLSVVTINNSVVAATAGSSIGAPNSVANGTVALGSTTTTGQLTYTGPGETSDRVIDLAGTTGGGTIDASGTGPLVFTSAFTDSGAGSKTLTLQGTSTAANTIQGCITNNSAANTTSLVKDGTGTWVLAGTNAYTGPTTVTNGTLALNGGIVSPVAVWSNATLTGTGWIATNSTALTVNGGTVDPGAVGGIGTLTVTGNVVFAGGQLHVDANGTAADLLAVTGSVTAASSPVPVSVTATGAGPWKVMTAANIAPTFASVTTGYKVTKSGTTELWINRVAPGTTITIR